MASYALPVATPAWQTLPAPTADAWLRPIGAAVYVSTDGTPNKATAGIVMDGEPYPVTAGVAVKVACVGTVEANLRMWDRT